jgi:hypothetical protein
VTFFSANWRQVGDHLAHALPVLSRWVGYVLMGTGAIALLFLWAYLKEARVAESGHHELWLYQQVCPAALHAASQGHPVVQPPRLVDTQRFYEACAQEAKH